MEKRGAQKWPLRELLLLLLLLCVSGLHAEGREAERRCLEEGQDLQVEHHYNRQYRYTIKAWQRVDSLGHTETLVKTETRNEDLNRAQMGRFLLEDNPTTGFITITMMGLQKQDAGLYQCVLLVDPPVPLQDWTLLVLCPDSLDTHASDVNPTPDLAKKPALPTTEVLTPNLADVSTLPTVEALSTTYIRPRTATRPSPTSISTISSPDSGVNFTDVTSVTRVPFSSIAIPAACGLLSKSLVFTVLFAVTQQSFRP
ncbi:triggering receptor expressed on myeloid cells 1 [Fukomys damarensis]|uniref:Triggering receptor expressed on myeloid cells 1 n=1 Tax=Fukomys damarensis TaxID=885580 RepID=A0A091DH61_FUKDA|nr:triggering receptor expressed on myeloid cells 1 [Fukomys damarensis]KFO30422.1 Triggering receptor expressed on myeloid cells 1 [Fukomys damarensis]